MYQQPPWNYPQGPYNPWCPPPMYGVTPPQTTGNPLRDLKRAIKFYTKLEKKQKEASKNKDGGEKKKATWKEKVDMYILLAISTPILIPLYSIAVHRLWEIAK